MMKVKTLAFLTGVAVTAAACAPSVVGRAPADTPPSLVQTADGVIWDNPLAFGPVPASVRDAGAQVCGGLNTESVSYVAVGYHPLATGVDGETLPSGGFFCVPE